MMRHKTEITIFLLTLSALIIGGVLLKQSNQDIAIHWNRNDLVDGYGPRWLLLIVPLMIPFVDILICLCRRMDPRQSNYDKFASSITTLRIITALLLWVCCMVTNVEAWRPGSTNISTLIIFSIGVVIAVFGNVMPRIRPNYFIGIRNPWTLNDDTIWRKTHRIAGRIWFYSGIVLCLLSLCPFKFTILSVWILWIVIIPNGYSYLLYRNSSRI